MPRQLSAVMVAAVIAAALGLAYSNSFTDRFIGMDAKESIQDNPYIRTLWPLSDAMSLPLLNATNEADELSKGGTVVRRPILSLSFALTYALLGPAAWGFHATNLAIHFAAALLLFGIVRRTLRCESPCERYGEFASELAFAVALLWAVHPLQTEAVTYLVQRAESLMALLFLLTLYASVRAQDSPRPLLWQAASVIACGLGMGTKESMCVAPLVVILYDYTFTASGLIDCLRRRWRFYVPLCATWTVLGALIVATAEDVGKDFDSGQMLSYLLAQPGVIVHYLRQALWPDALYLYVSTEVFRVRTAGWFVAVTIPVIALLRTTFRGLVRRRDYGFVGAWFFLILAPTSLVATSDIIQEHRMYLPLAAVVVVVVLGVVAGLQRLLQPRLWRPAGIALLVVAVLLSGLRTHARNADYQSEFAMIHPADLPEAYMILAQYYLERHRIDSAQEWGQEVLAQPSPNHREATFAHFVSGFAHDEHDELGQAAQEFAAAAHMQTGFAYAHRALASVLMRQGKLDEAARECMRAFEIWPSFPEAHYEYGMILMQQERTDLAIDHFKRALKGQPDLAEAHYEWGMALREQGDLDGAIEHIERALEITPRYKEARASLTSIRKELEESSPP